MNTFIRSITIFIVCFISNQISYGQVSTDSLWSFSSIRAVAEDDSLVITDELEVTVAGIVNIDSGLLHEHYLQTFIQNESSGMSIFGMRITSPLSVGDSVVVRGTIDRYYGLTEVRVSSYEVFSHSGTPEPKQLSSAASDPDSYIGMLVEGEGTITGLGTDFNGKYFMLSPDGSDDELMIYVSNFHNMFSDFNFNVLNAGDRVSVKGVISEHSPDFPENRTHKLFLRTPDDLSTLGLPIYYIHLIIGGIALSGLFTFGMILLLRNRVDSKTKKIRLSLEQKELLLKEIHHRVKNSLSIVSGLIEIQRTTTENREAIHVLQDSQARIQSIALIHDKLYKTESLSDIEMDYYIEDLVRAIHATFTEHTEAVVLHFDLDKVTLETDRAVYCGLLINELVVNAYKYAFSRTHRGSLYITLKRVKNDLILNVSDNGPGLKSEFNSGENESLGSMLIHSFAGHLQAEMEITERASGGTSFEFRFPFKTNNVNRKKSASIMSH